MFLIQNLRKKIAVLFNTIVSKRLPKLLVAKFFKIFENRVDHDHKKVLTLFFAEQAYYCLN